MYQAYLEGATLEQAGRDFGLTRERVRQLFKGAGLPTRSVAAAQRLRSSQGPQPAPAEGVTDKQLARVRKVAGAIALFRASGRLDESAARAGISAATLRRWLIRLNQPLPPTPRERVLLRHLADHQSKREIAVASSRTRGEIVAELERLFAKLGVANRADAVGVARDLGWLPGP
jgi:DNA-binding CsgD family transcriptional regulator